MHRSQAPVRFEFAESIWAVTQELVGLWWLNVLIICDFSRTKYWNFGFCSSSLKRVKTPLFFKHFKSIFYHKSVLKTMECSKLQTYKHKIKKENLKAKWNYHKKKKKQPMIRTRNPSKMYLICFLELDAIPKPRFHLNKCYLRVKKQSLTVKKTLLYWSPLNWYDLYYVIFSKQSRTCRSLIIVHESIKETKNLIFFFGVRSNFISHLYFHSLLPPLVKILHLVFIRWNKIWSCTEKIKYPLCKNIIQWYLSLILHFVPLDSYGYFMLKLHTYLYYIYISK